MSKLLPLSDFRAHRIVLTADDFAFEGEESPPEDPIEQKTWDSLTTLPTDVSIRTSDDNGKRLKILDELWGHWFKAMNVPDDDGAPKDDMTFAPMLDASEEFQAAIFNALHGFYRPAISCLRNALELIAIGSACQTRKLDSQYNLWRSGKEEFSFGAACDQFLGAKHLLDLKRKLASNVQDSLFDQRGQNTDGGWIRRIFSKLSNSSHSRPGFTSGDLWSSNGPVYVPEAFYLFFDMHIETLAACYIMIKIARDDLNIDEKVQQILFCRHSSHWSKVAAEAAKHLGLITTQ